MNDECGMMNVGLAALEMRAVWGNPLGDPFLGKKGSPKPPPKNRNGAGRFELRSIRPADCLGGVCLVRGKYRVRGAIRRGGIDKTRPYEKPITTMLKS